MKLKLAILTVEMLMLTWLWQKNGEKVKNIISPIGKKIVRVTPLPTAIPTIEPEVRLSPTAIETPTLTPMPTKKVINEAVSQKDDRPWGVAQQVDEVTWTLRVGDDEKMATAGEILTALNDYRQRYGSQILTWDDNLAELAQKRAKDINTTRTMDKHEGFKNFMENEDGFNKLGFNSVGENIAWGYRLNGVHTIEWMYGGDEAHNNNQLDNKWNYVGIGVEGLASCLIFGTGKF